MPAGKIAVSGGAAPRPYVHYGISISSIEPYAKKPCATPIDCQEIERLRRYLRRTFEIYMIECAAGSPTATERRKTLDGIKGSAALLIERQNLPSAYALLAAMGSNDHDALRMAYSALRAKGHNPYQIKRRLPLWTHLSLVDRAGILSAAQALAGLDIRALVPVAGRFAGPGLAHLVAALVPVWERVTGRRAAGLGTSYTGGLETKNCLFANWLGELHVLMRLPSPSLWRVVDLIRRE
jgi:hypothetical protein